MQDSTLKNFIDAVNGNDLVSAQGILTQHPEIVTAVSSSGFYKTALNAVLHKMYTMKFVDMRNGRVISSEDGSSDEEFANYKRLAITILQQAGVKLDTSDLNGNTPMHLACSLGLYDVAGMIVDLVERQGRGVARGIFLKKNRRGETPQDNMELSSGNFEAKKALMVRMRFLMVDDICFCDPISMELYYDPVITPHGHTFSRASLLTCMASRRVDPEDNSPLLLTRVRSNHLAAIVMGLVGSAEQEVKNNIFKAEVRGVLVCALTGIPLIDPVVASNGATYERSALEEYLNRNGGHLPDGTVQDRGADGKYTVYPNTFIKNIIERIKKNDEDFMSAQSFSPVVSGTREQQLTIPEDNNVLFNSIVLKLQELSGVEFANRCIRSGIVDGGLHRHIEIAAKGSCNTYEVFRINGKEFRVLLGVPEEFGDIHLERGLFFGYAANGNVFAINNQTSARNATVLHQGIGYNLMTGEVRYGGVCISRTSSRDQLMQAYHYLLAVQTLITEKIQQKETELQALTAASVTATSTTTATATTTTTTMTATSPTSDQIQPPSLLPPHIPVPVLTTTPTPQIQTPSPLLPQAPAASLVAATTTLPTSLHAHTLTSAHSPIKIPAATAAATTSFKASSLSCSSMLFAGSNGQIMINAPVRCCVNSSITPEEYQLVCDLITDLKSHGKDRENEIKALIFILQETNKGELIGSVCSRAQKKFPVLQHKEDETCRTILDLLAGLVHKHNAVESKCCLQ
jgi:hypothetical protein